MEVYKGKRLSITAGSLPKIDQHDNFTHAVSRHYRDRGQRLENRTALKNQSHCKIGYRGPLGKINSRILKDSNAVSKSIWVLYRELTILWEIYPEKK